ncbi:hypothetical protein GCM10020221_24430 [Streptomyces thioluteus]|uniref:tRNA methyltransferase TRMD/TRM10-type domain-containing protein n=1 Tax=Streptomyces thioluteus TaxID=66431 RepID=A0ABP6JB16_STRTU
MRLDVVTIFPEYLEPLNVSLVGKARARGRLDVRIHDLRNWTHDNSTTPSTTPPTAPRTPGRFPAIF